MPVPQTTTPLRRAAAMSIATLPIPVVISSLRSGRRSSVAAGNPVRSLIATTISAPARASTSSSGSAMWSQSATFSHSSGTRSQPP